MKADSLLEPAANPDPVFLAHIISGEVKMNSVFCVREECPKKWLEIEIASLEREAQAKIVPVDIIAPAVD